MRRPVTLHKHALRNHNARTGERMTRWRVGVLIFSVMVRCWPYRTGASSQFARLHDGEFAGDRIGRILLCAREGVVREPCGDTEDSNVSNLGETFRGHTGN